MKNHIQLTLHHDEIDWIATNIRDIILQKAVCSEDEYILMTKILHKLDNSLSYWETHKND